MRRSLRNGGFVFPHAPRGSDFGLDNVRPGFILGGAIGFLIGLRFPKQLTWLDFFP